MARTNSHPELDFSRLDESVEIFKKDDVRPLVAELGLADEQKITELQEQLTDIARWYEWSVFDDSHKPSLARKRLRPLQMKARALLKAIDDLDHQTRAGSQRVFANWVATLGCATLSPNSGRGSGK